MKKSILILFLLPHLSIAQTTLTGTIHDEKRNPVAFANVFLKPDNSSSIVAYGQSDDKGNYLLRTTRTGKMWLNFSAMSYKTARMAVELTDSTKVLTKNAILVYEPIELNEVIVSADKSMTVKKDTLIFNAKAFAKGNERVVEDLLKKIPGLNVSDDGTIKIGNREIEKIMIDGDDFFEKGYRILSKNMPAYPITKVEVYQHYSNNKLLKGIENSDNIALNLKMDEKSKRQWFGNISAGLDPTSGEKYEALGNLMNFGKKTKFYGIVNLNNTGGSTAGNVNYLINSSLDQESGSLGETQNANNLIEISTFSPDLKQDRILFNNAALYSVNGIFTLSPKVKMKALAFLNTDENNFYKNSWESISIGGTSFTNREDNSLKILSWTGFGKIDVTDDLSKTQMLVYTLKFNQSDEKYRNKLAFNDSVTNERLGNTNRLLDQKIVYTNRFQKNKVLLLTGKYTREQSPQHYSLDKFFYQDLFPEATGTDQLVQTSEDRMQYAALEAHLMDKSKKGNLLEMRLGNLFRSDNLNSDLSLLKDNITVESPSEYRNQLLYSTNDSYFLTSYRLGLKKFGLIASLDFHQIYNQMEKSGITQSQNPFFINPQGGLAWDINDKNKLMATYSYNHTNATILDIYDQYIHTGFRSFSKGTGNFDQLSLSSLLLNYTFGDMADKFIAFAFVMYTKNYDFYSSRMFVYQNDIRSEKILVKNRESVILSSNLDRYFKEISSTLKFNFGFSSFSFENMVNGSDLRKVKTNSYNYGLELRSGFSGSFNYHIGSKWKHIEVITTAKNSYTDNMSFLDLTCNLGKKLDFQLETERYYFGSLDKDNNTYYFLDANIRYSVNENKLSFTLSGQNLLDIKTFRNYSMDDISISRMEFRLLPRYFLAKIEYRF